MRETFAAGQLALLIDPKERRYLVRLGEGKAHHTHIGAVPHDAIIGQEDGCRVLTQTGHEMTVLRPTLADYILRMKRSAQVIYPKDVGPILVYGDIFPGARVIEAGAGSGALTMALVRAVGEKGRVVAYDIREDLSAQAARNIKEFLGDTPTFTLKFGDIYEGVEERDFDRVILDLPEPWRALDTVGKSLRQGGILLSYLPTVLQVHQLHQALSRDDRYDFIESFEVLLRPWYMAPTSARPVHRMVAHTGFLVRALRCAPRQGYRPPAMDEVQGPKTNGEEQQEL